MKRPFSIATLKLTTDMTTDAPGLADDKNIDDVALMASIAVGDRNAFNIFLSRHLSAVVLFAKRYLFNQADAEDIAQETFFRVWQKATMWQPQGHSPRSWLYRIAYNLCIDEIRRRPASESTDNSDADQHIDTESSSLEKSIERDSDLRRITCSLSQLPERQCTALSLCALQGLTNKEAATAMDISIEALESLLSRGRRQLRNQLQQDGEPNHE